MAVCDIHSVWAVFLAIVNKVEVCPLFAALRVFCHALRFFPSGMADHALRLGPHMRRSCYQETST